jgi:cytochrome P450
MSFLSQWLNLDTSESQQVSESATHSQRLKVHVPISEYLFGLLRIWWPIPTLFGWALITRYDDVEEALSRPDIFPVPFGEEIARLNDGLPPPNAPNQGTPFILGMDDRVAHDKQLRLVMKAFRLVDIEKEVAQPSATAASAIVANAGGRLEAIRGLVTQIPLNICRDYYGIPIPNQQAFAYGSMDVSGHLFGKPPIDPIPAIDAAATIVRNVVDAAINNAQPGVDTVLKKLLDMKAAGQLTSNEMRAFLMGMIVGFVPTNTMAGGHILDVLLDYPDALEAARTAAESGDDDLLAHCLFEALRFKPHSPGLFRRCPKDFIIASGTKREKRIKAGTKVLVSTMSAMFDCKKVEKAYYFVPGRPASDFLDLGFGMHWCAGAFIARAQITQTFKPLVLKENLRRAAGSDGKLKRRNGFPDSLVVEF